MSFVLERLARVKPVGWWGMVVMSPVGFRNGYVNLPADHPWVGLDMDEIRAGIHGGITFSDEYPDHLPNGDGIPAGWWVGFDCGHAGDQPEPEVWAAAHRGLPAELQRYPGPKGHVWSLDEVWDEVTLLSFAAVAQLQPS